MQVTRPLKANRLRKLDCHCGAFAKGANENQLLADTCLMKHAFRFEGFRKSAVGHVQSPGDRALFVLFDCFANIDDRHISSVDRLGEICCRYRPAAARHLSLR